jgi:diguanylate cyclase (GGDEF)-like protein
MLLLALPREVEIARRYRTELTLLVLDCDGLDAINHTHGRTAGDRVLEASARRLRDGLRSADLLVRLGGDEFAALLPMTSSNDGRGLGKRLLKAMAVPISVGTTSVEPKWSIGTTTLAADDDALALLWRADDALMDAKRQGGGTLATAHPSRPDHLAE